MNLKNLFIVNTVVAFVFGLAFVLAPGATTGLYDVEVGAGGLYLAQLFGAALLGYGVLTWFARDAAASGVRQAILLGIFVGDVFGFIVSLLFMFSGEANALGWTTVALYLLLALGFGYYRFLAGESMATSGKGALTS